MTNEEKSREIASKYESWSIEDDEYYGAYNGAIEMAKWKDEQLQEAKSLLKECYNTILGITALDSPEDIAKARSTHDSSLIKRIESFTYNNQ